jgi:ADP-ribose pyrophosphatase YjhB (NUDIX family)
VSDREGVDRREYPTRPIVGVGAVVLVEPADRGRAEFPGDLPRHGVVLIRRRFEPLAGQWSLPGGTLEVGETLDAAVAREIAEETGLAVSVGPVIDVFDRILLDAERRVRYHFVLIDYLCRPVGGRLRHGSDASEARVADAAALGPFDLTGKALAVIERGFAMAAAERPEAGPGLETTRADI